MLKRGGRKSRDALDRLDAAALSVTKAATTESGSIRLIA